MLVVTANWAVGDGTLVPSGVRRHVAIPAAIHGAVHRAGVRSDGTYRPVDHVDVVLAGDTFDWLVSAEWLGRAKPWHGREARDEWTRVVRHSVLAARRLLAPLVRWVRHGLEVPSAVRGRPGRTSVVVPVRLTLLAGDRDAALERHLDRGPRGWSPTVGTRWDDGRVAIRHGHDLDPACRHALGGPADTGRRPTLAESIAVDLVGRFAALAPQADPAWRGLARRLAVVGPADLPTAVGAWVESTRSRGDDTGVVDVLNGWRRCVEAWWHEARRAVPACEVEFDAVDAVAKALETAARGDSASDAGVASLRPPVPRGSPGTVLGHPRGPESASGVICLGGDAAAAPLGPAPVVACIESGGWPRWQSIVPAPDHEAVVAIRTAAQPVMPGVRIVDAA
ncbi:MAG: hypothetical protein ACKO4T_00265 [Planctomycetaceae bacterium]